jgi:anti-sigma-K factor RskA
MVKGAAMNSNFSDETTIREYLLGTLPEQEWDEIEQKLLSDEEFAEFVDSIEDEIIEEYLTIQNHFLRPPERQRKLLFASALWSNLRKEQKAPVYVPGSLPPVRTSRVYWGATLGAAAVLLLTVPLGVYTAMLHSNLATAQAKINGAESTLAQVSELAANLQKVQALQGDVAPVSLLPTHRAPSQPFTFSAKTKFVEIHIPFLDAPYHVDLRVTGSNALWSQDNVQPTNWGELIFRIPYYGPGTYHLKLKGSHAPNTSEYSFKAEEQTPGSSSKH